MQAVLITALALVVVSIAMVAVCEHAEVCRLRYRVWEVQHRRHSLERRVHEIEAQLDESRTPKRLLDGFDADRDGLGEPASNVRPVTPPRPVRFRSAPNGRPSDGRRDLRWFEFEGGAR